MGCSFINTYSGLHFTYLIAGVTCNASAWRSLHTFRMWAEKLSPVKWCIVIYSALTQTKYFSLNLNIRMHSFHPRCGSGFSTEHRTIFYQFGVQSNVRLFCSGSGSVELSPGWSVVSKAAYLMLEKVILWERQIFKNLLYTLL